VPGMPPCMARGLTRPPRYAGNGPLKRI
jgi:hypothetical protein